MICVDFEFFFVLVWGFKYSGLGLKVEGLGFGISAETMALY